MMEGWLTGETELLPEKLALYHFVRHKSLWQNPGLCGDKPPSNRLSNITAWVIKLLSNWLTNCIIWALEDTQILENFVTVMDSKLCHCQHSSSRFYRVLKRNAFHVESFYAVLERQEQCWEEGRFNTYYEWERFVCEWWLLINVWEYV
jgi:hypothetical protein